MNNNSESYHHDHHQGVVLPPFSSLFRETGLISPTPSNASQEAFDTRLLNRELNGLAERTPHRPLHRVKRSQAPRSAASAQGDRAGSTSSASSVQDTPPPSPMSLAPLCVNLADLTHSPKSERDTFSLPHGHPASTATRKRATSSRASDMGPSQDDMDKKDRPDSYPVPDKKRAHSKNERDRRELQKVWQTLHADTGPGYECIAPVTSSAESKDNRGRAAKIVHQERSLIKREILSRVLDELVAQGIISSDQRREMELREYEKIKKELPDKVDYLLNHRAELDAYLDRIDNELKEHHDKKIDKKKKGNNKRAPGAHLARL